MIERLESVRRLLQFLLNDGMLMRDVLAPAAPAALGGLAAHVRREEACAQQSGAELPSTRDALVKRVLALNPADEACMTDSGFAFDSTALSAVCVAFNSNCVLVKIMPDGLAMTSSYSRSDSAGRQLGGAGAGGVGRVAAVLRDRAGAPHPDTGVGVAAQHGRRGVRRGVARDPGGWLAAAASSRV